MIKCLKSLLILLIPFITLRAQVSEFTIYDNLNQETASAGGVVFNNAAMEFLPFGMQEISSLKKYTGAFSFNYNKGGVKFGALSSDGVVRPERETLENIDFIKSALLIYAIRPDFLPFISYYTPYKYHADKDLANEVVKRQDVVSAGFLSTIGKNSIAFSMDYNWSDYQDITSTKTYQKRAWGLSNRLVISMQTAKYLYWTAGAVTPVYSITKLDKQSDEYLYLNKKIINTAFHYDNKEFTASYGATYREFNTFVDNNGDHINHPWIIEHKLTGGYYINNGVRFILDYQLQPSIYIKPQYLAKNRHSIGAGLFYRYNNSYWNFYGSDSRLLSADVMARTFFQLDIGFTF